MLKRIARMLAIVYVAYLSLCLLILLPVMNILAPRMVQDYTGRELSSELILFNPFTLALELRGLALNARAEGEPPLVAFERLRVNLSTASLWSRSVVLDEVLLDGLDVSIRQLDADTFNFSDLLPAETVDDDESAELPGFTVNRLAFQADHLEFIDLSRSPTYRTYIDDLDFTVEGLSTVRDAGSPYQLSVVTEHDGRLDWKGDLSLATQESAGEIRLTGIDLRPVYRYLEPQLGFSLGSALLDITGRYSVAWQQAPAFSVSDGRVTLRGISMLPRDPKAIPDTSLTLDSVIADGIDISSDQRSVDVSRVTIDALAVSGYTENETHSLLPMFVPALEPAGGDSSSADAEVDDARPSAETLDAGGSGNWQISLDELLTENTSLRWRSPYTTPKLMQVAPVRLALRDLAWPATRDSDIDLSLRVNDQSELVIAGSLDAGTGAGSLDYRLQDQPLAWFNPVLAKILNARIQSGALGLEGSITLSEFAPSRIALDTGIEDFGLRIYGREASALSWERLGIPDVLLDLEQETAAVGKIRLEGYIGRLHILPDGRINVLMALPEAAASEEQSAAPTGGSAVVDDLPSPEGAETSEWAIRAEGLELANARLDFDDEALPIPFRTLIRELNGSIGAVDSSKPDLRTPVSLQGSVDGYAPVTIEGNVAPFADSTGVAIDMRFQGMDIANLTPYTATYAGYAIDSGTLNLDLSYTLEGDRLQGENRAVISRMTLGERVESERALDLPLKLALALLTDSRGVIDLEVPIQGNIDNPEFSLGRIIGRTLRNILTKAVTAPFRLLASLVGSEQNLQELAFAPGEEALNAETRSKLDSLAVALDQRPALNVLVRGSIDPQADVDALKEQVLAQRLVAGGLTADDLAARNESWRTAIATRYAGLGLQADAPSADTAAPGEPAGAPEPAVETMYAALLERTDVPQETVGALVRTRAAAVKRYMVTEGGIAADRVTVSGRAEDAQIAGAVLDVST